MLVLTKRYYDWVFSYNLFKKLRSGYTSTLDIGCKDGSKINFFKPLTNRLVGLDIVFESVCEAKAKGIEVVVGDAKCLPFSSESFDAVTIFHVLEHIDKTENALGEIYRVLRKDGFALIVTPNRKRLTQIIYKFFKNVNEFTYPMNPDHQFEFTESDLRSFLSDSKFQEYHIIPLFFGLITNLFGRPVNIGLKRFPRILSKYCNQYVIWVRKLW